MTDAISHKTMIMPYRTKRIKNLMQYANPITNSPKSKFTWYLTFHNVI